MNKKFSRGDFGYVKYTKRHNLKNSIILILCGMLLYIIGEAFFEMYKTYFLVAAALLVLPLAQMLSRYISFIKYKTLKKDEFYELGKLSGYITVLPELPIVRGRKEYPLISVVITNKKIYCLVDKKNNNKEFSKGIFSIIEPKGHRQSIELYDNYENMYTELKKMQFNKCSENEKNVQKNIARLFVQFCH